MAQARFSPSIIKFAPALFPLPKRWHACETESGVFICLACHSVGLQVAHPARCWPTSTSCFGGVEGGLPGRLPISPGVPGGALAEVGADELLPVWVHLVLTVEVFALLEVPVRTSYLTTTKQADAAGSEIPIFPFPFNS
jgi:hypothetical protein